MCPMQAGVYVRISQDRGGSGLGVARQEADCRALAARKRWQVVEVYIDNDTSAYSGKPRPQWQRLLADVEAGRIDAIIGHHVDRLTRSVRELEDVITLADRHGLSLATVAGEVDLGTTTGRTTAHLMGVLARHEAEAKGDRQRRERRQSAEAGKVAGGGTRPYGYADDRVSIVDDEADVVREAARRALAGESLSLVCRDFAARGVTTTTGRTWRPTTLRRLLASARISGRREHTPRRAGQGGTRPLLGEIVAAAVWPPIITADQSDRLRALLSSPVRAQHNATGRTYLLSGILRCGRCGGSMSGRPKGSTPRYVCPNTPGGTTCGRTATNTARTDELIRDMVLTALDSPALTSRLTATDDATAANAAALREAEGRLEELAATWAAGEITRGEWRTARDVLEKRARALRETVLASRRQTALGAVDLSGDMRAWWDAAPVGPRRELVAAVVDRVTVRPADQRKRWDPDRFDVAWRA